MGAQGGGRRKSRRRVRTVKLTESAGHAATGAAVVPRGGLFL